MARKPITRTTKSLRSGNREAIVEQTEPAKPGKANETMYSKSISDAHIEDCLKKVRAMCKDREAVLHSSLKVPASDLLTNDLSQKQLTWAVSEFRLSVDNYGMDAVLSSMDDDTFWKLHSWFKNAIKQRHL